MTRSIARIRIVEPGEAEGFLKSVYEEIKEKRGKIANIHKVFSLRPQAMKEHLDLYLSIMYPRLKGPRLERAEREAIAVVVSSLNKCRYCIEHHKEALSHFIREREVVEALASDYKGAPVDSRLRAILRFAEKLTLEPWDVTERDVNDLRRLGLSDEEILDVVLVASYFNFINRVALALGVEFDEEEVAGYKYE